VIIFCNHGFHAGASLSHPHSQLVVVPKQINLDAVSMEPIANIVVENDHFVTYCPEFSQWPYEVWVAPKIMGEFFGDITDDGIKNLAPALRGALKRIELVLKDPELPFKQANEPFVYNYYIYHGANWFLRITPRAVHRAGFELGTGLSVNVVDPTDAAERLRNQNI
jgi:UDPglucose--hexose-1-phosphate uridylyltransferase